MKKQKNLKLVYRERVLVFLFFSCLTFLSGCEGFEKDRKVILVLIDYSASSSSNVLEKYINIINNEIFSNLGQNDCLIVMPIDEGSKKEPVKLIYEDMLQKKFTTKADGFAHAQDSINLRMQKYVSQTAPKLNEILHQQRIIRRQYTNYTDIISAVQQSDNLFDKRKDTPLQIKAWDFVTGHPRYKVQNVLVLLSDMIQETEECSFNNRIGISYRKSGLFLEGLKNQGRIADLSGCKVFAIGSTGKNARQIDNIKSFWNGYFAASNAELAAYGYDVDDKLIKYLTNENY